MTYTIKVQPVLGNSYTIPWRKYNDKEAAWKYCDLLNECCYDTSKGTYVAIEYAKPIEIS